MRHSRKERKKKGGDKLTLEDWLSEIIKSRGINLAEAARSINVPYMALYDSLRNKSKNREIKGRELVKLCRFLDINPMDFEGNLETGKERRR